MTLVAVSIAVHEPDDISLALQRAEQAVRQGAQLIAHGSDFGAVMQLMPVFGQTMKDGLGKG